jgi:hypothetical protein
MEFGLDNWIYCHPVLKTRDYRKIIALSLIYTLHSSRVTHALDLSSLVVSWQRIYNRFTVNFKSHNEVYFAQYTSFLAISSQSLSNTISRTWSNSRQQLKRPSLSLYNPGYGSHRKQPLYCWEGLFSDLLSSNGRSIVARVCFWGNMFTESLPRLGLYVTTGKPSKTVHVFMQRSTFENIIYTSP